MFVDVETGWSVFTDNSLMSPNPCRDIHDRIVFAFNTVLPWRTCPCSAGFKPCALRVKNYFDSCLEILWCLDRKIPRKFMSRNITETIFKFLNYLLTILFLCKQYWYLSLINFNSIFPQDTQKKGEREKETGKGHQGKTTKIKGTLENQENESGSILQPPPKQTNVVKMMPVYTRLLHSKARNLIDFKYSTLMFKFSTWQEFP